MVTRSERAVLYSIAAGFLGSSCLLAVIGLSVSFVTATLAGRDPLAAALLVQSGPDLLAFVSHRSLGDVTYGEISTIAAALAFLGSTVTALPLIYQIVKREGFLRLLTLSYGMLFGLGLILVWFEWSNTGNVILFKPRLFEVGYLYLAFLLAEAGKLTLEHRGISALPYFYAIDGAFGTIAVLIIQIGYKASFAGLLLGPFFLVAVAVAMFLCEWTLLRPGTLLIVGMSMTIADRDFEAALAAVGDRERLPLIFGQFRAKLAEAAKLSYLKRVKLIESVGPVIRRALPRQSRRARPVRLDWRIAIPVGGAQVLFLALVIVLGWLVF
jgi:hypothetical protein